MGNWDSYCFICGAIATGENINIYEDWEIIKLNNYIKEGSYPIPLKIGLSKTKRKNITPKLLQSYKNYLKDLKKIKVNWLENIIVITKDKNINGSNIIYTGSGTFKSKNKNTYVEYDITKGSWSWTHEHDMIPGLVCHKNCHLLLSKQFKKKINFEQVKHYLNEFSLLNNKYNKTPPQLFSFPNYLTNDFNRLEIYLNNNKEFKIIKKNLNFISDPLINKENFNRILKLWVPIIKKIKTIKLRPSPSDSATLYNIGFKNIGNDGNKYIIVKNKNGVKRWKKI